MGAFGAYRERIEGFGFKIMQIYIISRCSILVYISLSIFFIITPLTALLTQGVSVALSSTFVTSVTVKTLS